MSLASYEVVATVNTAWHRVPGYIAVSGGTQPASAAQDGNRGALHSILLYHPSSRTRRLCSFPQTQQPMIVYLGTVIFGVYSSDSRLAAPARLCGVEGTTLCVPSNLSVHAVIVGGSGYRLRTVQNQTSFLSEENTPASEPYLLIVICPAAFRVVKPAAVIDQASTLGDAEDGRDRKSRAGRGQDWENVHACSRTRSPDGACVCSPLGNQGVCVRANACAAKVERAYGASSRGARTSSRLPVKGCARTPAWTSCDAHG
jgi:hypothetical protein